MSDLDNITAILDGIREELARIRIVLEQDAYKKSMILQKANDENSYTRLQ
jgi:hypothetical protein